MNQMKIEEEIQQSKLYSQTVRNYYKTPIPICELNYTFQQMENQIQNYDSSKSQFNRIDKEFRTYVNQFSVIKKKEEGIKIIQRRFKDQLEQYSNLLLQQQVDEKELSKLIKKFQRTQIKAWNLNLDKAEDIKVVCNANEFTNDQLEAIAQIIKDDNHD